MRINFRQGLISFQTDNGNAIFLHPSQTSGFISHIISPTPTVVAVAHGESDYLLHFDREKDQAWGPVTSGQTNYLYWDVDLLTGDVTYGITLLPLVVSALEPAQQHDQHWFDLASTTMKVWNATRNKWQVKIRVFAGSVLNGNTNQIVHQLQGSQVALNTPSNPGYIMRDTMLQPLRKSNGEFLTDDTTVRVETTVGTSGVLVQPVNRIVPIRAGENIPAMSLVYFSDEDTVRLASSNPALVPTRVPVGIVLESMSQDDVGHMSPFGEITYDQWDWSAHAGEPLYVDYDGQLTLTRPAGLLAYRAGFVKNKNTVLLGIDAETSPQVYQADTNALLITGATPVVIDDEINGLGERVVNISITDATPSARGLMTAAQATSLDTNTAVVGSLQTSITALETGKADAAHTHVLADVTGLQTALDGKADAAHTHSQYAAMNHNHDGVYATAVHAHTVPEVTGLQTELNNKANRSHLNSFSEVFVSVDRSGAFDVGSGQTLSDVLTSKSDVGHGHAISAITNLQTALDGKSNVGHGHTISEIPGLQSELDNRAFVSHTHSISAITNLQTTLDGKSNVGHTHNEYAPTVHLHEIADVNGLQTALSDLEDQIGANSISTLTDTDVTSLADLTPTQVSLLVYIESTGKWVASNLDGQNLGIITLPQFMNFFQVFRAAEPSMAEMFSVIGPGDGQYLKYQSNGNVWVPTDLDANVVVPIGMQFPTGKAGQLFFKTDRLGTQTPHRYWRAKNFQFTQPNHDVLDLSEFELFVDNTRVDQGVTVTTPMPGSTAALHDGSFLTHSQFFGFDPSTFYVKWDFASTPQAVNAVRLGSWDSADNFPTSFELEFSDDNLGWTTYNTVTVPSFVYRTPTPIISVSTGPDTLPVEPLILNFKDSDGAWHKVGTTSLSQLTDVDATIPSGETPFLAFDGTVWKPFILPAFNLRFLMADGGQTFGFDTPSTYGPVPVSGNTVVWNSTDETWQASANVNTDLSNGSITVTGISEYGQLTLKSGETTNSATKSIITMTAPSVSGGASRIEITGGSGTIGAGGRIQITGGDSVDDVGGQIQLRSGVGSGNTASSVVISTGPSDRVRFDGDGVVNFFTTEWRIGGTPGTPGQVIKSMGAGLSPAWGDVQAADVTGLPSAIAAVTNPIINDVIALQDSMDAVEMQVSGLVVSVTNADNLTSGTVASARLGSGTADGTTYLRGDGTWSTLPIVDSSFTIKDGISSEDSQSFVVPNDHATVEFSNLDVNAQDGKVSIPPISFVGAYNDAPIQTFPNSNATTSHQMQIVFGSGLTTSVTGTWNESLLVTASGVVASSGQITVPTPMPVGTLDAANFTTGKFMVTISDGTDLHAAEIMVLSDGDAAFMTTGVVTVTNVILGTFTCDVDSGLIRLLFTKSVGGNVDYKTRVVAH